MCIGESAMLSPQNNFLSKWLLWIGKVAVFFICSAWNIIAVFFICSAWNIIFYREYSKGRESGGERERETLHVTKPIWPLSFLCILKSLNFRFRVIILKTKMERGRQDFIAGLIMLMHSGFGSWEREGKWVKVFKFFTVCVLFWGVWLLRKRGNMNGSLEIFV